MIKIEGRSSSLKDSIQRYWEILSMGIYSLKVSVLLWGEEQILWR